MEGVELKLWSFADSAAGWPMLWRYRQERDGVITAAEVEALAAQARPKVDRKTAPPPQPAAKAATGQARLHTQSPRQEQTARGDRPAA